MKTTRPVCIVIVIEPTQPISSLSVLHHDTWKVKGFRVNDLDPPSDASVLIIFNSSIKSVEWSLLWILYIVMKVISVFLLL